MFIDETGAEVCDWEEGVYLLQEYDPVQGGKDGISNKQAKTLALRTRNLHNRVKELENRILVLETLLKAKQ